MQAQIMTVDVATLSFTPSQINNLRNVAAKSDPYAAYGRSLLYILTGEQIEPAFPATVVPRARVNTPDMIESYTVSPNPATEYIEISVENSDMRSKYRYEVVGIMGKKVLGGTITHTVRLDTHPLPAGMYLVRILRDEQTVSIVKCVIIR